MYSWVFTFSNLIFYCSKMICIIVLCIIIAALMFTMWEVLAIEINICNCTGADNRGLLDLEPPDYCSLPYIAVQPLNAEYNVYTVESPQSKFEGFTCVAWEEKKTIVGYFFGSYDTTYETVTKSVTTEECRRMARFHECGGPNIKMTIDEGSYVYNRKPDCDGKYWQTDRCITLNCVLSPVTVTQNYASGPIISPYGRLTNDSEASSAIHGHRTFIWEAKAKNSAKACKLKNIHSGKGTITYMGTEVKERLQDSTSQLEFHYIKNSTDINIQHGLCTINNVYQVTGVPDTWIEIIASKPSPEPWESQLARNKSEVTSLVAWGAIKSGNIEVCLLTSHQISSTPAVTIASCQGKRFQHFELTTGGMLRINDLTFTKDLAYKTQSYCLVVNPAGELQTMTCALEQKYARNPWSYNPRSKRIVSGGLCLTLWLAQSDLEGPRVIMSICDAKRSSQDWYIEFRNNGTGKVIRDDAFAKYAQGLTPPVEQPKMPSFIPNGTDESMSLLIEHHQYTEGRAVGRENVLSNELHMMNCAMMKLKKFQLISLAQSNGFLAAKAVNLPMCQRLQSHGTALIVQTCKTERVNVTAIEGPCGMEPFHANFTIGLDGYSLHPYMPCFRKGTVVSLNDKAYIWQNGDWIETQPSIKINNINLVGKFDEIDDNESEYMLKPHEAFEREEEEQVNQINDIVTMMHGTNANAMQLVMDETSKNNMPAAFSWPALWQDILTIFFIIAAVIITALIIKCLIAIKVCSAKKLRERSGGLLQLDFKVPDEKFPSSIVPLPPVEPIISPRWNEDTKSWSFFAKEETTV